MKTQSNASERGSNATTPEPDDVALRPATADDRPAMLRVWRDAVDATHDFLSADDVAFYEAMVRDAVLPGHPATVATIGDSVVGWSIVVGDDLACLFVDPARHRAGIGRRLVEASGATTVDVNEQNAGGRAFYERLGFAMVGRSDLDGAGRPHPLLHLRRETKNPAGAW